MAFYFTLYAPLKLYQMLNPYVIRKLNKIRGPSPVQTPQMKEPAVSQSGSFHLSERELHELLVTAGLIAFVYAVVQMARTSSRTLKEIELISKRFDILMGMPLKKVREILKGNDVE